MVRVELGSRSVLKVVKNDRMGVGIPIQVTILEPKEVPIFVPRMLLDQTIVTVLVYLFELVVGIRVVLITTFKIGVRLSHFPSILLTPILV